MICCSGRVSKSHTHKLQIVDPSCCTLKLSNIYVIKLHHTYIIIMDKYKLSARIMHTNLSILTMYVSRQPDTNVAISWQPYEITITNFHQGCKRVSK